MYRAPTITQALLWCLGYSGERCGHGQSCSWSTESNRGDSLTKNTNCVNHNCAARWGQKAGFSEDFFFFFSSEDFLSKKS